MIFLNDRKRVGSKLGPLAEKMAVYLSLVAFATVFLLQQMMALPVHDAPSLSTKNSSVLLNSGSHLTIDIASSHKKGLVLSSMDMEEVEVASDESCDEAFEFDPVSIFHPLLSESAYVGFINSRLSHQTTTARIMPSIPCFVLYHCWKGDIA